MQGTSSQPVIMYDSTPSPSLPGEQSPENIKRAKLEWERRTSREREWLGPAKLQRGEEDADQIQMEMALQSKLTRSALRVASPHSEKEDGRVSKSYIEGIKRREISANFREHSVKCCSK